MERKIEKTTLRGWRGGGRGNKKKAKKKKKMKRADVNKKKVQQGDGYNGISWNIRFHKTLGSEIKQLAAVLQLWLCGQNHFVALDVNYMFIQNHGLWHWKDPKHGFSVFSTQQIALQICNTKPKKGRQMSSNQKSLAITLVLCRLAGWSWNKRQRKMEKMQSCSFLRYFFFFFFFLTLKTQGYALMTVDLLIFRSNKLFKSKKKRVGYILISRSSHKNRCYWSCEQLSFFANMSSRRNAIC